MLEPNTIIQGHVLDVLRELPDESIHCCITSPPYWGLRDYGTEAQVWGGAEGCEHVWGDDVIKPPNTWGTPNKNSTPGTGSQGLGRHGNVSQLRETRSNFCSLCSAWRGSLGLEPTPDLFVQHMVTIFREVRRVLRADGTLWLNLGASYASSGQSGHQNLDAFGRKIGTGGGVKQSSFACGRAPTPVGFKPKDLIPIPWMVAMALQADGWWLRSSIIWAKGISFCPTYSGSCMPESVRDRPTQSYEYVFLLSKAKSYYYDAEAVREPLQPASLERWKGELKPSTQSRNQEGVYARAGINTLHKVKAGAILNPAGRNLRSVWALNPHPLREAHFATFPPKLVEPCLLAGTSERGVCPECGGPWERVVEKPQFPGKDTRTPGQHTGVGSGKMSGSATQKWLNEHPPRTIGWQPTCDCGHSDTVPAVVLDPFMGSGTVALVALQHKRRYFGIELQPDYIDIARKRIRLVQPKLF